MSAPVTDKSMTGDGATSEDATGKTDEQRAREILAHLRDDIDNLDAVLVYTLAQRFKATQAVGKLKAEHDLPPSDPAREDRQIARLHRLCEDSGLDPEFAKKFLNFIIQEVIRHHESLKA